MNVQRVKQLSTADGVVSRSSVRPTAASNTSASESSSVVISDAAQTLSADAASKTDAQLIQQRLDAIKAKPALQRTAADTEFVNNNDARRKQIQDNSRTGGPDSMTADDLDYMQKAGGFVNTMSTLSPKEKALYDDLVASGNQEAAQGMRNIALSRVGMGGQQITLPNGTTFDPTNTELTGDSVRNGYRFMFADASGQSDRAFDALATALDQRQAIQPVPAS